MIYRLLLAAFMTLALLGCESSAERAEAAYERGLELIEAGDDARAGVELRNALKLDENHFGARLELARLNYRAGQLRPSYRNFLGVVEQQPDHVEGLQSLSRIAFLLQDWEVFERYSTRAIEIAPDDVQSRILDLVAKYRAMAMGEAESDPASIIATAERLREEAPDDPILRRVLVDAYLNVERYADALTEIDRIIENDPENPQYYQVKLQILSRLGDMEALETELREMVAAFPDDPAPRETLIRFLISQEDLDAAEAFLREEAETAEGSEEERTAAFVNLTRFLQLQRGPEAALAELEKLIEANPDNHVLQALQATLNFETGARDLGISQMEALLELDPESGPSPEERQRFQVGLARMLMSNGNEVGARRLVSETLETDPDNAEANKMQARWLIEEDETNAAIMSLRTALATDPRDAQALTLMASAYQRAGDKDLMMNFLSLAVEAAGNAPAESLRYASALLANDNVDQAESTLMASLRLNQDDPELLRTLGQLYLRTDDRPRLRQVIEALQRSEEQQAKDAARAFELELIAREAGRDQAMQMLSELAETESEDGRLQLTLIRAQLQSGNFDEALEHVEELIEKNPDNVSYTYFKAVTLAGMQRTEDAIAAMEQIVEENPNLTVPWLQLARLRAVEGTQDDVLATLREGLEANPDAADLLWATASLLEQRSDIDGALEIYENLYETTSNSVVVANNLASMLVTYRDDEESLNRARVIARRLRDSEVPAMQDTYGWILYRTGEIEESVSYLEAAAEGLPGDPVVQAHLGMAYAAVGRAEDARAQLDRARNAAGPLRREIVDRRLQDLEAAIETAEQPAGSE